MSEGNKPLTSRIGLNGGKVELVPVSTTDTSIDTMDFLDDEVQYRTMSEITSHYTLGEGDYVDDPFMHESELKFIKKLQQHDNAEDLVRQLTGGTMTLDELVSSSTPPEKKRQALVDIITGVKDISSRVHNDRAIMNEALDMIQTVNRGDATYSGYLNDNKDLRLAKLIASNLKEDPNDDSVRYAVSNILSRNRYMEVAVPFQSDDYKENGRMIRSIKTALNDSYNINSKQYEFYNQTMVINKDLKDLTSKLYDEQKETSIKFAEYLDNSINRDEMISRAQSQGLLEKNLTYWDRKKVVIEGDDRDIDIKKLDRSQHAEGKVVSDILEAMDQRLNTFKESVDLNDKKTLPRQPATLFRNAVGNVFLQNPESAELKKEGSSQLQLFKNIIDKVDANKKDIDNELIKAEKRYQQTMVEYGSFSKKMNEVVPEFDDVMNSFESLKRLHKELDELDPLDPKFNAEPNYDLMKSSIKGQISQAQEFIKSKEKVTRSTMISEQSPEDSKALVDYYKEYDEFNERLREQNDTVQRLERISGQGGFDPNLTIDVDGEAKRLGHLTTSSEIQSMKELLAKQEKAIGEGKEFDVRYTMLKDKEANPNTVQQWIDFSQSGESVRVKGKQGGYQVTSIRDGHAFLKREHLLLEDVQVNLDVRPEEIDVVVAKMEEKARRNKEVTKELTDNLLKETNTRQGLIEVRFDQNPIDKKIGEHGDFLLEKMQQADAVVSGVRPDQYGEKSVFITPDNLKEQLTKTYMKVADTSSGIGVRPMAPTFLMTMLQSHAGHISSSGARAGGTAIEALEEVIDRMATDHSQSTIDISDGGLIRAWKRSAIYGRDDLDATKFDAELDKYMTELPNRTQQQRLEDHLFLNVLQKVHQVHHGEAEREGSKMDNALKTLLEELENRDLRQTPENIRAVANDPKMHEMYEQAPYYRRVARMGDQEINSQLLMSVGNTEYDDSWVPNRANIKDNDPYVPGDAVDIDPDKVFVSKEKDGQWRESQSGGFKVFTTNEELAERMSDMDYGTLRDGKRYYGIDGLNTLLEFAEESGKNHVTGTASIDGSPVNAFYYRGKNGDIMAHIPSLGKKLPVSENGLGLDTSVSMKLATPQRLQGGSEIMEDVGDGGAPKRQSWGSYATMQRSGKYTIPTNPSVTLDAMLEFFKGKSAMTYMDIESTGLASSTIDNKYLQPIEVYAEKFQWDREAGDFMLDDEGNHVITNKKGEKIQRSKHFMVSLMDDTKSLMNDLIQNEDFTVQIGEKNYSILDYDNELRLQKESPGAKGPMMQAILNSSNPSGVAEEVAKKHDRLWFLRNIAKYAWSQDERAESSISQTLYDLHAGNTPIPKGAKMQNEYLRVLKENTQQAGDNLDRVGVRADIKSNNPFIFAEGQVGGTVDDMVKSISKFVGSSPVVGQNVAQADWGLILDSAKKAHENAQGMYEASHQKVLRKIDAVKNDLFVDIKSEFMRGTSEEVLNDPAAKYVFGDQADLNPTDSYRSIDDWMRGLNDLQKKYRDSENADYEGRATFKVGEVTDNDVKNRMTMNFKEIKDLEKAYKTINRHGVAGLSDDVMGIMELDFDLEDAANELKEASLNQQRTQDAVTSLKKNAMVEQLYLSQILNPELDSHAAQVQMEKWGITPEALHIAKDDVQNNMKLMRKYSKSLLNDHDFEGTYDNTPFKKGDVVEMYKSIGVDDTQLGAYQITKMDLDNHVIEAFSLAGDEKTVRVEGSSKADLARRFETHFSFIGTASKKKPLNDLMQEYHHDQSRRSILRSMDSAFNFDLAELEGREIAEHGNLQHQALINMQDTYIQSKEMLKAGGDPTVLHMHEQIAMQNPELFESNKIFDLLDKEASPQRQAALEETLKFSESEFGKKQRDFLDETRKLEQSGAITRNQSESMIADWNQAIKEKGMERGAKHSVMNEYNLGTMAVNIPGKDPATFENRLLNTTDARRVEASLWKMANDASGLVAGDENEKRKLALKNHVAPFLAQKGLIDDVSVITDTEKAPSMNFLVSQVTKNTPNVDLPIHEQFDPLAYDLLSKDQEMMSFMDNKKREILGETLDHLSITQKGVIQSLKDREAYLRDTGMYNPNLSLAPDASEQMQIKFDAMNFDKHGGIGNYSIDDTVDLANLLDAQPDLASKQTRNTLFGKLFYDATGGRNISGSIDDIIREKGEGSNQVQAMKALNWVVDNPNYNPDTPDLTPRLIENTDIGSRYFGVAGDHAGTKMADLPRNLVERIAEQDYGQYTRDNQYNYQKNVIEKWQGQDFEGHRGPSQAPFQVLEDADGNTVIRDNLAKSNAETLRQGAQAGTKQSPPPLVDNAAEVYPKYKTVPELDLPTSGRPQGAIERAASSAKNWATEASTNMGSAGKWIAGIGIAAFALHSFRNANTPIQLQQRPEGHGVASVNGGREDDVKYGDQSRAPSSPTPSTGNSVYVNGGEGQTIKVKGKASSDMNYEQMQNQMKEQMGEVKINMRDDRETFNRDWLQKTFDQYIDRGFVE